MRWFCRRLTEIVIDHGHYLAVYLRETPNLDEADRKKIMRRRVEIDNASANWSSQGSSSGEFEVVHPRIAASAITMMISCCFQWYRKDDPLTRDEFAEIMSGIAMRTLLPTGALRRTAPKIEPAGASDEAACGACRVGDWSRARNRTKRSDAVGRRGCEDYS